MRIQRLFVLSQANAVFIMAPFWCKSNSLSPDHPDMFNTMRLVLAAGRNDLIRLERFIEVYQNANTCIGECVNGLLGLSDSTNSHPKTHSSNQQTNDKSPTSSSCHPEILSLTSLLSDATRSVQSALSHKSCSSLRSLADSYMQRLDSADADMAVFGRQQDSLAESMAKLEKQYNKLLSDFNKKKDGDSGYRLSVKARTAGNELATIGDRFLSEHATAVRSFFKAFFLLEDHSRAVRSFRREMEGLIEEAVLALKDSLGKVFKFVPGLVIDIPPSPSPPSPLNFAPAFRAAFSDRPFSGLIGFLMPPIISKSAISVHNTDNPNELQISKGELVRVIAADNGGWWFVENAEGHKGLVPSLKLSENREIAKSESIKSEDFVRPYRSVDGRSSLSGIDRRAEEISRSWGYGRSQSIDRALKFIPEEISEISPERVGMEDRGFLEKTFQSIRKSSDHSYRLNVENCLTPSHNSRCAGSSTTPVGSSTYLSKSADVHHPPTHTFDWSTDSKDATDMLSEKLLLIKTGRAVLTVVKGYRNEEGSVVRSGMKFRAGQVEVRKSGIPYVEISNEKNCGWFPVGIFSVAIVA